MEHEMLDKKFAYLFQNGGRPIRHCSQLLRGEIETPPMDKEWLDTIRNEPWSPGYTGSSPYSQWELAMQVKLLSFGGQAVCLLGEPEADKICERGQFWYGDRFVLHKGRPNGCHENSLRIWHANRRNTLDGPAKMELVLATGYALSQDGLWRQHSWCLRRGPHSLKVIETTVPRLGYFGYILTEAEAEKWLQI